MARSFRPTVSFTDTNNKNISFSVKSYAIVKQQMKDYIKDSINNKVNVYRHRRGEWGEWFEHWEISNGKPVIVKEGWQ